MSSHAQYPDKTLESLHQTVVQLLSETSLSEERIREIIREEIARAKA